MLRKIPKKAKRASRWRSQAHLSHVRSHACVACDCDVRTMIEAAHVRIGSGTGMGQKPDDWRAVPLCKVCHAQQHEIGERTFWDRLALDPETVIVELIKGSPRRTEINAERSERND